MTEHTRPAGAQARGTRLLILHAISEESPWCESCVRNNATGFERFVQVPAEAFGTSAGRAAEGEFFAPPDILAAVRASDEPWVLLLWDNIGLDGDFLFQLQFDLLSAPCDAAIYAERSLVDGSVVHMPRTMRRVPGDLLGKFPSNLLIRRSLLEQALSRPEGIFFPRPICGVLRELESMGVSIAGREPIAVLHNAPLNCAVSDCGWACEGAPSVRPRRVLILTHELSRTGAPIVLLEACVHTLIPAGYELFAVSPMDGVMKEDFLRAGIPVMIMPSLRDESSAAIMPLVLQFDLAVINTIVLWAAVRVLDGMGFPVLWWIHDADCGYCWVERCMPDRLAETTRVYGVGEYACQTLRRHKPEYPEIRNLIYGIRDVGPAPDARRARGDGKTVFVCSGSLEYRKGQDILCKAIELLPDGVRRQCMFMIVGRVLSRDTEACVRRTCERYPDSVEYCGEVKRARAYELYARADCIVCASRDDPMPTFVAEGMMFGTPSICSENTGTAHVLTPGVNGFVYEQNSPERLAQAIQTFLALSAADRGRMSEQARRCFLDVFEQGQFKKRMLCAVEEVIKIGERSALRLREERPDT